MSSPRFPLTVTRPVLLACLNWRWLPSWLTSAQPSSSRSRITSRTFTRRRYHNRHGQHQRAENYRVLALELRGLTYFGVDRWRDMQLSTGATNRSPSNSSVLLAPYVNTGSQETLQRRIRILAIERERQDDAAVAAREILLMLPLDRVEMSGTRAAMTAVARICPDFPPRGLRIRHRASSSSVVSRRPQKSKRSDHVLSGSGQIMYSDTPFFTRLTATQMRAYFVRTWGK